MGHVGLLILIAVLGGNTPCPDQSYPPIPATLEAAKIAVNPASFTGQRLFLKMATVALGQTATVTGSVCDPDGDPVQLTSSAGTITAGQNGAWTLKVTPTTVGITYIDVTATDVRTTQDSLTARGTVAVVTVARNRAPVLASGGAP